MCESQKNDYFKLAADETILGMKQHNGGPFGATIVRNGEVVVSVGNTMIKDTDPSAHAEMVAVRDACKKLDTMDLSDCEVYATCEPCPMCVGVMMWANIKKVYYSNTKEDAKKYGFSDMPIREYLDHSHLEYFNMECVGPQDDCDKLWDIFEDINKK